MKWVGIISLALVCAKLIFKLIIIIIKVLLYPFIIIYKLFRSILVSDEYDY